MFSKDTDGLLQWIPKQIVEIDKDFHSQVGDVKVRSILYNCGGKDMTRKNDTWEPITHLQDM